MALFLLYRKFRFCYSKKKQEITEYTLDKLLFENENKTNGQKI